MSDATDRVIKAVEKGFARRGVSHERAERVHRLLLADGPMACSEIAERLDLTWYQVAGSDGAMVHLLADGRAYGVKGRGPNRMYYATDSEEGDEVPCICVGLVHKDTCPNWRLPV